MVKNPTQEKQGPMPRHLPQTSLGCTEGCPRQAELRRPDGSSQIGHPEYPAKGSLRVA